MSLVFNMVGGGGGGGIKLASISITTPPAKTTYTAGETFDPAGMVVEATYSNGATLKCTGYSYEPNTPLTDGTTKVTIRYTEGGVTATAEQAITVSKAAGSLSISPTSLTLDKTNPAGEIIVDRAGDGAISAVSSAPDIAEVSVSGNIVTVTGKASGNATITISVAEGTNHTAPASKTCAVSVNFAFVSSTLNDNDWATIRQVSDNGQGANYWSIGDTKTITINGAVGNTTFSNLSVDAFILGFNHNSSREGANRIHFKIGKIGGKQIALVDSNYGSSGTPASYFQMNASNTNSVGWNGSSMRKTLLGNSGTPTSPPSNSLLAALPTDLRAVMKAVAKYSDNVGNKSDTASNVTSTTDYLFLLSEFEYHGARTYANSAEKNYQAQYDYYKAGNSKIHYKHNATGTAAGAWCRSVHSGDSGFFCFVGTGGRSDYGRANYSRGVAPGFCV